MFASKPLANLLVIRSANIEQAVKFYQQMGMLFELHAHGKGPDHYASDSCGFVFEIYPQRDSNDLTTNTRIGFRVDNVDGVIDQLREIDATILAESSDTEWGRRAVVKDFDGHTIELVTPMKSRNESHAPARVGFVASGQNNLRNAFEEEARMIVEAKYSNEWMSAGFFRRWILRRTMTVEIADIVAMKMADQPRDTLY